MATSKTYRSGGRRRAAWLTLWALTAPLFWGCGGSDVVGVGDPDPAVEPFVGDWEASEFVVTNLANPDQSVDVTEGGSFTLNVQPSGQYTAILDFPDSPTPGVELGQLSVVGNSVRLSPISGDPITSAYTFEGADRLILDGPTAFDWNRDGELEASTAHIVLERN
jgi:hypothetical protein